MADSPVILLSRSWTNQLFHIGFRLVTQNLFADLLCLCFGPVFHENLLVFEHTAPHFQVCCCCWVASVVSDSVRPHRRQPTRLPHPWDFPGQNTGVGCHFLLQRMKVKVKSLSRVRLLATSWTAAYQAPPSMGFSRQEYWHGVPSFQVQAVIIWFFVLVRHMLAEKSMQNSHPPQPDDFLGHSGIRMLTSAHISALLMEQDESHYIPDIKLIHIPEILDTKLKCWFSYFFISVYMILRHW